MFALKFASLFLGQGRAVRAFALQMQTFFFCLCGAVFVSNSVMYQRVHICTLALNKALISVEPCVVESRRGAVLPAWPCATAHCTESPHRHTHLLSVTAAACDSSCIRHICTILSNHLCVCVHCTICLHALTKGQHFCSVLVCSTILYVLHSWNPIW